MAIVFTRLGRVDKIQSMMAVRRSAKMPQLSAPSGSQEVDIKSDGSAYKEYNTK